eukprot:430822-Rhodomonas_salina.1
MGTHRVHVLLRHASEARTPAQDIVECDRLWLRERMIEPERRIGRKTENTHTCTHTSGAITNAPSQSQQALSSGKGCTPGLGNRPLLCGTST